MAVISMGRVRGGGSGRCMGRGRLKWMTVNNCSY